MDTSESIKSHCLLFLDGKRKHPLCVTVKNGPMGDAEQNIQPKVSMTSITPRMGCLRDHTDTPSAVDCRCNSCNQSAPFPPQNHPHGHPAVVYAVEFSCGRCQMAFCTGLGQLHALLPLFLSEETAVDTTSEMNHVR